MQVDVVLGDQANDLPVPFAAHSRHGHTRLGMHGSIGRHLHRLFDLFLCGDAIKQLVDLEDKDDRHGAPHHHLDAGGRHDELDAGDQKHCPGPKLKADGDQDNRRTLAQRPLERANIGVSAAGIVVLESQVGRKGGNLEETSGSV